MDSQLSGLAQILEGDALTISRQHLKIAKLHLLALLGILNGFDGEEAQLDQSVDMHSSQYTMYSSQFAMPLSVSINSQAPDDSFENGRNEIQEEEEEYNSLCVLKSLNGSPTQQTPAKKLHAASIPIQSPQPGTSSSVSKKRPSSSQQGTSGSQKKVKLENKENEKDDTKDENDPNKVRCELCRKFFSKNYIREHKQWHKLIDAKKRLKCTECDYTTTTKSNISKHFKKKHPGIKSASVLVDVE